MIPWIVPGSWTAPCRTALLVAAVYASQLEPAHAQSLPRAEPNDQRIPAGRTVDGELRVELEAIEAEWYPRGAEGPRVVTVAFAEVGRSPLVPGPLIRAVAGTSVRVSVRNTLARPIVVRGLLDRAATPPATRPPGLGALPAFAFAEPLLVPPGDTRETRFTPTAEVSSFYFARTLPPDAAPSAIARTVGPGLDEGAFMGALVIDPRGAAPPQGERLLVITRWNAPEQGDEQKMFVNGLAWPFTERLEYAVGDSARWRVINASGLDHPMHLHGFHFTVNALGDTDADTSFAAAPRPLEVTQMMAAFSAMRLTWVPERAGNWLFHCHLIVHMGEAQQFAADSSRADPEVGGAAGHDHVHDMAGLITGITVRPPPGGESPEERPVRRIDLWTGQRPDVYDGQPELAFVVQESAAAPPQDSTRVPGSPLVLTRGEPTEIVVHNRLEFPLSVHWHGLELRSLYDGVGGWSGQPGDTRPPIPPGDSARVVIAPVRAGTFMYHTHGEPGHELSQGLYGPFLVLDPGEVRDADSDRVFTLASRGARQDLVPPAINGRTRPPPERFAPGRTYRLRFIHISADDFKRVRLLKDGQPVGWVPLAKDGAELPEPLQVADTVSIGLGVGETYDVAWTPAEPGTYLLEVTTVPFLGGTIVQRVAFGVGDIAEAELLRAQQAESGIAELSAEERARFVGTWAGSPVGATSPELVLTIRDEGGQFVTSGIRERGDANSDEWRVLVPLGPDALTVARDLDGALLLSDSRYRLIRSPDGPDRLVFGFADGRVVVQLVRVMER